MMTKEAYVSILSYAQGLQEEHLEWRWGQTVFNTLEMLGPTVANAIRGTKNDMFYIDENVNKFKNYIKAQNDD